MWGGKDGSVIAGNAVVLGFWLNDRNGLAFLFFDIIGQICLWIVDYVSMAL